MSDDEGPEDYGDYEDAGELGGDESEQSEQGPEEAEPEPEAEPGADEDLGLEEDAAGTDEDEPSDEGGADEEEEPFEPAGASSKATPQRARVDPILRESNKSRLVVCVAPEERMTSNCLQKPEAAYIIAIRAEQISKHPTAFVDLEGLHDPVAIAHKELYARRCPLTLRRPVGFGPGGELLVEEWCVRDMSLPPLTPPVALGGMAAAGGRARL